MSDKCNTLPELSDRELDMILASLRHWQASKMISSRAILEIAEEHGTRLSTEEIDDLCIRLNWDTSTKGSQGLVVSTAGPLITVEKDGTEEPLGYLTHIPHQGVYDKKHGRLNGVTPDQAATHNQRLSNQQIDSLNSTMKPGEKLTFFWNKVEDNVSTMASFLVATRLSTSKVAGHREFWRGDRLFRFAVPPNQDRATVVEVTRIQ